MISKAIEDFDQDKPLSDKSTDEKASIVTKSILTIKSNFILNKIVTLITEIHPGLIIKSNL